MSEFLHQIEILKSRDKSGKNIFAIPDPGTGDITIYRYILMIGPKKETPHLARLLTKFTFNPESASSTAGIDLSQVVIQIPEDDSLEDSQGGFEAFMADLVATHTKFADTWLGTVKREERANAEKEKEKNEQEGEKCRNIDGNNAEKKKGGNKRRSIGDDKVNVTVLCDDVDSGVVSGEEISEMDKTTDDDFGVVEPRKADNTGGEDDDTEEENNGHKDEPEEEEEEEEEEDDWKPPTLAEQCQRMYREINDVYKRRNAAAAECKWRYWEQFAGAEIIMRVRHIWWMDVSKE